MRRGHANCLCVAPSLTDDPRKESTTLQLEYVYCTLLFGCRGPMRLSVIIVYLLYPVCSTSYTMTQNTKHTHNKQLTHEISSGASPSYSARFERIFLDTWAAVMFLCCMPNLPTDSVEIRRFYSIISLILRGGILMYTGDFPGNVIVMFLCCIPLSQAAASHISSHRSKQQNIMRMRSTLGQVVLCMYVVCCMCCVVFVDWLC